MKSQKVLIVMGIVALIIGFILFLPAQIEIMGNGRYTWEQPYTSYEAKIIIMRMVGILFLVCGAIDTIMYIVSKNYVFKNVKEVNESTVTAIACPECGIKVDKSLTVCPKCKKELRH